MMAQQLLAVVQTERTLECSVAIGNASLENESQYSLVNDATAVCQPNMQEAVRAAPCFSGA